MTCVLLLRRYDDHSRVFRQFHRGIEGPHQAILYDPRNGDRTPCLAREMGFDR
jgi:hypothetical protein